MTTAVQSPSGSSPRCGRPLTTSYVDLMRPDEDWRNLPDAAERRKIQNRLAQRAYRRNMRDRTKEVERLKKQLQQLQSAVGQDSSRTPPPENESPLPDHHHGAITPPTTAPHQFSQQWTPHSEALHGLGLTTDGENPLQFDTSPFMSGLSQPAEMMTGMATPPSAGRRARAVTTSNMGSHGLPPNQHLRSNSTGPLIMPSNCSSPMPNQWPQTSQPERRTSVQMGGVSAHGSPMIPVSRAGSFSLCNSPEEAFLHSKPAFALEEGMGQPYPPPPDAEMQARTGWSTPIDGTTATNSPMTTAGGFLSSVSEIPEMTKPLPETTAPLLHFAIASGQIDTLRFLLARSNVALNARDNAGYTPLQRAIANGRTDMAAVLLEHGAAVDEDFKNAGEAQPRI